MRTNSHTKPALCLSVALLTAAYANVQAAETFKVCADPLNPPYSDKQGHGFENKIAELFAKQLGQTLEYTWFPQRMGFINNTLKAEVDNQEGVYKCDVVMGVPAGFDMTATTIPYYHSSYVLLIAKGRGWDKITDASQLANLPLEKQESLKIAMFDQGPGATWLQYIGLLAQGIPYQTMSGDSENNTAMQIDKDIKAKKIDMVVLWGPLAGHVISKSPKNTYTSVLMPSGLPGMKFDFSMAMGVRFPDKERKNQLDGLIEKNREQIQAILSKYNMPLLPIPKPEKPKDD
ncbi:MAG: quinoprotein dehydrogenase-associated putative ABC transporter substrate-binding protein [Methylococcaceae bacterium]|nr:quinoprotein dehydrogenase-associated putative ABC transporter substrate-binding protein [Methylococcaceae bacterium]